MKLRFKGDKPKRVRPKQASEDRSTVLAGAADTIRRIETSWTSAMHTSDITGPVCIVLSSQDPRQASVRVVAATQDPQGGPQDTLQARKVVQVDDEARSMSFYHTKEAFSKTHQQISQLPANRFVPSDVSLVFTCNSAVGAPGKHVLKSRDGRFVGVSADGSVTCHSEAVGPANLVSFEQHDDERWGVLFRLQVGGRWLGVDAEGSLVLAADPGETASTTGTSYSFVVRVHAANSSMGKSEILRYQEAQRNSDENIEKTVEHSVAQLEKNGVKINPTLIKRIKLAIKNGKLNEQMIIEKEKSKSDSRC